MASCWGPAASFTSYIAPRLLLIVGWERALRYAQTGGRRALVGAGLAFGFAAWFKHDIAGYAAIGTGAGLVLAWWAAGSRRPAEWLPPIPLLLTLGGAALALVLPLAIVLAVVAGPEAWEWLIVFPLSEFRTVRGEDYPALWPNITSVTAWLSDPTNRLRGLRAGSAVFEWTTSHAPELVYLGASAWAWRERARLSPASLAAIAIVLTSLPFYWAAAHVQRNTHLTSMALLSGLALAVMSGWLSRADSSPWRRRSLAVFALVYAACLVIPNAMLAVGLRGDVADSREVTLPLLAGQRVSAHDHGVSIALSEFVRAHVPEGEPIYVGLARHDAIVIGNGAFYYLADRPNATRYHELHPGVVDRERVQREIIGDLERHAVRCVVIWHFGWGDRRLDSILAKRRRSIADIGAGVLDEYLRANYQAVARFGQYQVTWRRGAAGRPQGPKTSQASEASE
jgi:hypothetical protein